MKQIQTALGTFTLHPRYVIGEPLQNAQLVEQEFEQLKLEVNTFYQQPFAYIANRANLNGVDPRLYPRIESYFPNLQLFAVVAYSVITFDTFAAEKIFMKRMRSEVFHRLPDAIQWVEAELAKIDAREA